MILTGDSGGTKTELALFEKENDSFKKIISENFLNKEFTSLEQIINIFLKDKTGKIESACIGIAGTVIDGKATSTNLKWELDEKILSYSLKIKNFKLANDLEVIATAVDALEEKDVINIFNGNGIKMENNKAVLAPGTGLGVAALIFSDGKYNVVATEGGHSDFAPSDEIEIRLLEYLNKKFDHVSWERVASGLGLLNVFNFLKDENYFEASDELLKRITNEDGAAVISDEALKKKSAICEKALDIFASALGAQAGNLVLNYKAIGGVYLGGGIPMKIIDKLQDGTFVKSYLNKGRLSNLVEMTPVFVIKDKSIGLLGAALMSENYLNK